MHAPTFLIVAGMPCSGKSQLLRASLEAKHSLFGTSFDEIFQKTRVPSLSTENKMKPKERLEEGYWLHESDLIWLKHRHGPLNSCVIHFDIYWFYITLLLWLDEYKHSSGNQVLDAMNDPGLTRRIFEYARSLFPPGSRVVTRMLEPEYREICGRWRSRCVAQKGKVIEKQQYLHRYIYNNTDPGKLIYRHFGETFRSVFKADASSLRPSPDGPP